MAFGKVKIVVSGKVQGVFFRQSTQEVATSLGLKGWVENTENGQVRIEAAGTQEHLEKLISWCKVGSPRSQVENVKWSWEQPDQEQNKNQDKEDCAIPGRFIIRR